MRNVTKTTFFSFIFPTVLYLTAKFQHCSMRHSKVRAELKRATHAQPCCDPILDLTLEMLGNLSFTRRYLINFFIKNLHFFFIEYLFQIYCILSSEWLLKCSSTWFAAVLDMPSRHVEIWSRHSCFHCWARSRGDRNNCGARNSRTAGLKRRKRKIWCFYKDEFISRRDVEHLSLR